MKKLFAAFTAWALVFAQMAFLVPTAVAQSTIGASRAAGRFIAVNYNYGGTTPSLGFGNPAAPGIPPLKIASGNGSTGSSTITLAVGYVTLPDGRIIFPLCAGSNVTGTITCGGATPITVNPGGSNQETVTPTAVSGCNVFPVNTTVPSCQVTASFSNLHNQGEFIQSGTAGMQEAYNDAQLAGGGLVAVDAVWSKAGGTTSNITSASMPGPNAVAIEDSRTANASYWYPTPGLTNITVPTALTTASTLTTSTTGGSIATATTPRFCVTAVDQFGGETACSNDSAGTATLVDGAGSTNSYTITAAGVPTGTGIVGYRLYVTASGGGTQTETVALAANLSGTVAPLCPLPGCMAPGVAITLISLPATTNAGPPPGTAGAATALNAAHTTVLIKQAGLFPTMLPFANSMGPGAYPTTVTSATTLVAGFDVMGELQYPAGFFNSQGSNYRICGGGVVTPSVATVAGTWTIRLGPRVNSAGTAPSNPGVSFGFVASNQWTAAASNFDFCTDLYVVSTGASGTVEGHGTTFCVVVAAGNDGAGTDTCVGAANATSSAIDLTQQGVVELTYVQSAASWTLPQLRYFSITRL